MSVHVLGICGTFMGGIAALARERGISVSGSDQNIYPPMSTQLEQLGIDLKPGYSAENLQPTPDLVIVGNALSRGNAAIEHMLDSRLNYISGPQWLGENVLATRQVLAVAGTHGKTTTTSLLAWILDQQNLQPGFLVGGVPSNFGVSARLGAGAPFVIEADEYDTAFFDKRSKFVHYRPHIAVLNNLEYDHADIFPDVAAIQRQFHHLVRIVPGNGRLIVNAEDKFLREVLAMGCWTPVETFGIDSGDWRARLIDKDGSVFEVSHAGKIIGIARWSLLGRHNVMNALAAIAAAHAAGADAAIALNALASFENVQRRMELIGAHNGVSVYDDFAHHPTAIATTLAGLRAKVGGARVLVGIEPRSNSMRLGAHADELAPSLRDADAVVLLQRAELPWDAGKVTTALDNRGQAAASVDALIDALLAQTRSGDHVVFMSNGGFENAPRRFFQAWRERHAQSDNE
ncbi:UDP-N-acetylmuramate:L-alanyl-gamma-D-glutamyl-meso-diaminopimelate ligase [Pseudolysobacter antarcticus]|uniref:UDP-N-acetylmuramate--L-alanyl-gamma-D-glutamyl-meso-2,6-diaminoheptandioate ligase n=1 Tax=Pseudolysobacter antarcticus TaxID=2511995 RepID=A0A411HFG8_9GAMM|nr:UDP-N-acetylmuramate:L-alanyl-gamma-D-glutamyl-meso-diaminopimelate ligase [Pseudolysobacter antarcticus]QBB69236.1 UDP-N-acetylmuramate:L-alanyl-gamma-D-glutamyl-meso-diaminopimelate ligase [Pseudolysobacter antarcticus]